MRNANYRKIRQARDQCLEKWIQGKDERYDLPSENFTHEEAWEIQRRYKDEDERCWTALHYTKDWATAITPVLKDQNGAMAVTIEKKEDLVREFNFPVPPSDDQELPELTPGEAYKAVNMDLVHKALYYQSVRRASGPDRINFHALCIMWSWDAERMLRAVPITVAGLSFRPSLLVYYLIVWLSCKAQTSLNIYIGKIRKSRCPRDMIA